MKKETIITTKNCPKCNEVKPSTEYYKDSSKKEGYSGQCKICIKQYKKDNKGKIQQYYLDNKEKLNKYTRIHHKNNPTKQKQYTKKWQNKNKEHLYNYNKNWREENKDYYEGWKKKYKEENKESIKKYGKEYHQKKYENDIEYRLKYTLRGRLYKAITKESKNSSYLELLGCSPSTLIHHLEQQFKPEMNWGNYGKYWEIDHIKPCSSFDLINLEEQLKCFHFTNLQPLFTTTEIAKSFGYINEIGNRNKSNK
jgi:hypothetical protein